MIYDSVDIYIERVPVYKHCVQECTDIYNLGETGHILPGSQTDKWDLTSTL